MIAVHVGAGYHAQTKLPLYKQLCQNACQEALHLLSEGGSATSAATLAVAILENSPVTNAGLGSNLTETGQVECDACVMNDDLKFGACGAVQGIRNPVKLANLILENQYKRHVLGRVPPCVLVGQGAYEWAKKSSNVDLCPPEELKTAAAIYSYNKYMAQVRSVESQKNGRNIIQEFEEAALDGVEDIPSKIVLCDDVANTVCTDFSGDTCDVGEACDVTDLTVGATCDVTDTVGAVCMDSDGRMAASASSGGILLKHPGRIGPAAMFGCGCWAETSSNKGVAIAASGCGEQLMQTLLVRQCASKVIDLGSDASTSIQESLTNFLTCTRLTEDRNAGLLVLSKDENDYELAWGHTTQTMVIGYGSINLEKPQAVVSRNAGKAGHSNVLSGVRLVLNT